MLKRVCIHIYIYILRIFDKRQQKRYLRIFNNRQQKILTDRLKIILTHC